MAGREVLGFGELKTIYLGVDLIILHLWSGRGGERKLNASAAMKKRVWVGGLGSKTL